MSQLIQPSSSYISKSGVLRETSPNQRCALLSRSSANSSRHGVQLAEKAYAYSPRIAVSKAMGHDLIARASSQATSDSSDEYGGLDTAYKTSAACRSATCRQRAQLPLRPVNSLYIAQMNARSDEPCAVARSPNRPRLQSQGRRLVIDSSRSPVYLGLERTSNGERKP